MVLEERNVVSNFGRIEKFNCVDGYDSSISNNADLGCEGGLSRICRHEEGRGI